MNEDLTRSKLFLKKNLHIEKCKQIKELVQNLSGVEDIGLNVRFRKYSDLRKIYCTLCRNFTESSLTDIGYVLRDGFDHATVLHNLKQFSLYYPAKNLDFIEVYESANEILSQLKSEFEPVENQIKNTLPPKKGLKFTYIATLNEISNKSHSIISRQMAKIKNAETELQNCRKLISDNIENIILK